MKTHARTSLTRLALVVFVAGALSVPVQAKADPTREFIMSCSYGVLAGTLVGAATLAFSDKPGENLNKVARGASIGLYAGILLGLYVVYGGPSAEDEIDPSLVGSADVAPSQSRLVKHSALAKIGARYAELPKLQVFPLVGERGLEGAAAQYSLLRF